MSALHPCFLHNRWTTATQAKIYISTVWERFVPHFCKPGKTAGRVVGIPDRGMKIRVGRHDLIALPAHFLHAEGNFQFYDPVSHILFSGDLGRLLLKDIEKKIENQLLTLKLAKEEAPSIIKDEEKRCIG